MFGGVRTQSPLRTASSVGSGGRQRSQAPIRDGGCREKKVGDDGLPAPGVRGWVAGAGFFITSLYGLSQI